MRLRDCLQAIDRGSPGLHEAVSSAAATDRAANDQRGALARGASAVEMDAAGLRADKAKDWPGEGAGHGHNEPGIPTTPTTELFPPLFRRPAYLPMVGGPVGRLIHDLLAILSSNGLIRQHVSVALPANTCHAAHPPLHGGDRKSTRLNSSHLGI